MRNPNTQPIDIQWLIQSQVTNNLGFNRDLVFAPKGAENYLSLQIRLGEMNRSTQSPDSQERIDLRYMKAWRKELQTSGKDKEMDVITLDGVMRGSEKFWLKQQIRGYLQTTAFAAATLVVGLVSGNLWNIHTQERSEAISQSISNRNKLIELGESYKQAETEEERTNLIDKALPVATSYSDATRKLDSIDEMDTPETAIMGLGLMTSTIATGLLAYGTYAHFREVKRYLRPSKARPRTS